MFKNVKNPVLNNCSIIERAAGWGEHHARYESPWLMVEGGIMSTAAAVVQRVDIAADDVLI